MKIHFSALNFPKSGTLVLGVTDNLALSPTGQEADKKLGNLISRALKQSRFKGETGQWLSIAAPESAGLDRVALVGLGKANKLDAKAARKIGATLAKELDSAGISEAFVAVDVPQGDDELAAELATGALLKSYRFDKYRTNLKDHEKASLVSLTFLLGNHAHAESLFAISQAVADGVFTTRDLVSEPANIIHPESLADFCKTLSKVGIEVEVLGEKQMEKLGMGALLGVGRGSSKESKLVIMRWNGGNKGDDPVAFIGKGVTFDMGGICIKPAAGMEEMKWDMGGSAVVIGLMRALAARKAKANVIGVVGLVENMISGEAQRPGDVVKTMSGQTVEVINTDAEGRLVLADALWYTQDRFKPKFMINLATLTGAIIIALGKQRAGLFSNNDELAGRIAAAGEIEGERVWRLPIGDEYESHIKSDIADMKNVGKGREAGSISAAQFLERYVNGTPWAHIDIAGTTWTNEELDLARKGATGFGVRLLNRLVKEHYEQS